MKLLLVISFVYFHTSQARSIAKDCQGLPCEEYDETQTKIVEILKLINPAIKYSSSEYSKESIAPLDGTLDGCTRLTNEQADDIIYELRHQNASNEQWKIQNFNKHKNLKWNINKPIKYRLDDRFNLKQKSKIKRAISQWEKNTCVRWQQTFDKTLKEHHILFNRGSGCNSFVGKISHNPQYINYHPNCFYSMGPLLHEIGHSLGLYHEQARFDRNKYIKVNRDNIFPKFAAQFELRMNTVGLGVKYDFNSMMHYGPKDGGNIKGRPTMESLDQRFQSNMGQRVEISFLDSKIINRAYCKDICQTQLDRPCENDGYQDPNNCKQCKCPDGLGGQYCETAALSVGAECGGNFHLNKSQDSMTIKTPLYEQKKNYKDFIECSWLIEAPPQHKLKVVFGERFGIFKTKNDVCYHWLEVKSERNIGANGPRLCGKTKPKDIISTDERILLVFKSNYWTQWLRTGFKATITAEKV